MTTLSHLLYVLLDFVADPTKSWGEPSYGSLTQGNSQRVAVEHADMNSSRLLSGTYTPQQHADFYRQARQVERNGSGTARFSGSPNNLPASIPEHKCAKCSKPFRSVHTEEGTWCYECHLYNFCPELPGKKFRAGWIQAERSWERPHDTGYRDGWSMEANGDVGFHNEMRFYWQNRNECGSGLGQSLFVRRTAEGEIRELVFQTLALTAERCYAATFDVQANTVKFTVRKKATSLCNWEQNAPETMIEVDPVIVDLMVAMLPEWMLFRHRPPTRDTYMPAITMAE